MRATLSRRLGPGRVVVESEDFEKPCQGDEQSAPDPNHRDPGDLAVTAHHAQILDNAEAMLKLLELPYRVVAVSAGCSSGAASSTGAAASSTGGASSVAISG